ncbi:MAG: ABC transporter permease subunit, partial [Caldilineaceae bacterium]
MPLLFLAGFYFYPLAGILRVSFAQASGGEAVWMQPFFWRVLWFTTWQAGASTLLTLLVGLPLAWLFARFDFPGKGLLRALTTIPFVMPTVVVAAAFTSLIGPNGLLNGWLMQALALDTPPLQLLQTVWVILLAHVFYNVSVVIRTVGSFWANLSPRYDEAAAALGADSARRLRAVTLPLLLPSVTAAGLLVFLFCFTSFGGVWILGGLRYATLEVEIYRQAITLFNLPAAALLSLVQMGLTFGVMAVYTRVQRRASLALNQRPARSTARRPRSARETGLVYGGMTIALVLLLAPLASLAWQSISLGGQGLTLAYFGELAINRRGSAFFVPPLMAIRNSVLVAVAVVALSLLLGMISAYLLARPRSRWTALLDPLFLLPLGTSAVTLGLGYIVSMGSLRASLLLIPIAHTLIAAPFVVRTLLPALRGLNPRLREAGASLGASPFRVWRGIDLPLL